MYGYIGVCLGMYGYAKVDKWKIVKVENWKRKNWKIVKVEKQDFGKVRNLLFFGKVENWKSGKLENFKSGKVEHWKIIKGKIGKVEN